MAPRLFDIVRFDFLPQNAVNAEKSFEALLSHVIGELSKDQSVYEVNSQETSMVSHWDDCLALYNISASRPARSLSLSHCSAFSPFPVGQWILCFPERRWPNISTALQGRYTSQYYQRAAGKLLIKHPHCFPLQLISSVWSPQSIEFSLRQFCLPFLRLSCLLQHHLYGDNLTGCLVRLTITVKSYPASLSLQTERSIPLPYC